MDGVGPTRGVEGSKTCGVQNSVEDAMTFTDVETVVVLAVHEIGMVDLQ